MINVTSDNACTAFVYCPSPARCFIGGGEDGYACRFAIGLFDFVHAVVDGFQHTVGGGGAIGRGGSVGSDCNAGFRPGGIVELLALGEQVLRCLDVRLANDGLPFDFGRFAHPL